MKPLSYHESIRVLLEGTCGANNRMIQMETKLTRAAVFGFLQGTVDTKAETVDAIGMLVWRRMNAHLLISDEDRV